MGQYSSRQSNWRVNAITRARGCFFTIYIQKLSAEFEITVLFRLCKETMSEVVNTW